MTRYPPYVAFEQAMIRTFEAMKKRELRLADFYILKTETWVAVWVFFVNEKDVQENAGTGVLGELEMDFRERLLVSKEQSSFQELPPISFEFDSKENIDKNYQESYYLLTNPMYW
jgi:hypothetical protein